MCIRDRSSISFGRISWYRRQKYKKQGISVSLWETILNFGRKFFCNFKSLSSPVSFANHPSSFSEYHKLFKTKRLQPEGCFIHLSAMFQSAPMRAEKTFGGWNIFFSAERFSNLSRMIFQSQPNDFSFCAEWNDVWLKDTWNILQFITFILWVTYCIVWRMKDVFAKSLVCRGWDNYDFCRIFQLKSVILSVEL